MNEPLYCLRKDNGCRGGMRSLRGLCRACFARFQRGVASGKLNEAAEIAAGRVLPKKKSGQGSPWRRRPARPSS